MDKRFDRTCSLIGIKSVERLQESKVAIFGIGGVGSFTAEALARAGVGCIHIFDNDKVDVTNINRQLIALESTVGKYKVDVMAERMLDINPNINVEKNALFITPEVTENLGFEGFDYVIDCIDNVTAKISLCQKAREMNIPVISAMGAGNKLDPTAFKVAPIEKTSVCPLARVMRRELKIRNITGVKAVYSEEPAIKPTDLTALKPTPASISFVPSVAGLIIAGEVIKDLIGGISK